MPDDSIYDSGARFDGVRPDARERLVRAGPTSLSDADLVSVLLGTGIKGKTVTALAEEVLGVMDTDRHTPGMERLCKISGMGDAKACVISSAFELGRRFFGSGEKRISSPRDLFPMVSHWADRKQERFICASLNGAHEIISIRVVSLGLVNRTIVHPREVFADAMTDRASAIVVAHNHPSGRLDPSPEDIAITRRLKEVGELLGIALLDHLVFSRTGFYSFVEHGLIDPGKTESAPDA